MPGTVVDSSVVAAWAFGEPRADGALEVLHASSLYASTLLTYELGNIARSKAVQRPDQLETVIESLQAALALPVQLGQVNHVAAARLALETGLSAHDASYLLMARELGAPLVTFDKRLEQAARQRGQQP